MNFRAFRHWEQGLIPPRVSLTSWHPFGKVGGPVTLYPASSGWGHGRVTKQPHARLNLRQGISQPVTKYRPPFPVTFPRPAYLPTVAGVVDDLPPVQHAGHSAFRRYPHRPEMLIGHAQLTIPSTNR